MNLKPVPNGHYSLYYLRIGQPVKRTSRIKALGVTRGIFINFDRAQLNSSSRPQFEIVMSPDTSQNGPFSLKFGNHNPYKKLKDKQNQERDHKYIPLATESGDYGLVEEQTETKIEPLLSPLDTSAITVDSKEYYEITIPPENKTPAMMVHPEISMYPIDEVDDSQRMSYDVEGVTPTPAAPVTTRSQATKFKLQNNRRPRSR